MSRATEILDRWTTEQSAELYGVPHWGGGYFGVSKDGELLVYPQGRSQGPGLNLAQIVKGLSARGVEAPLLLRFEEILHSRLRELHECFATAINGQGYRNVFRGVYPIKVNQQEQVISQLTRFGSELGHGLEAGSKAELIAALPHLSNPESLLICNGYKDEEFIDIGLFAVKMGVQCIFVIETPLEVGLIVGRSRELGIRPKLGVRAKLSSKAGGHWKDSGGDRSVFGLAAEQIVEVVDQLRTGGMLDCLELLHYHLGSQIPDIRSIRSSVVEAARLYVGLVREGAPMGKLDLGGGLAVDYDGSHTNFQSSANYSLREYCEDIVEVVKGVMEENDVPHPMLVTESGRATVAHHSVLVFNVLDVSRFQFAQHPGEPPEEVPDQVRSLAEVASDVTAKNAQECFHDAVYYRDELRQLFRIGAVTLRQRAFGERLFWHIVSEVQRRVRDQRYVPDELADIDAGMADIYYGNFSVFQSLPDSWAINQLFPVMPIHRLNEEPKRQGVISDITCDCDGKIDSFTDLHDVKKTLPLHELRDDEEYYLGVFLIGAYQETLGDLHNLFGDTHVVAVRTGANGGFEFGEETEGDTVADVLSYVEYDPKQLSARFRAVAEEAVRAGRITVAERKRIMKTYEEGMRSYTYFER